MQWIVFIINITSLLKQICRRFIFQIYVFVIYDEFCRKQNLRQICFRFMFSSFIASFVENRICDKFAVFMFNITCFVWSESATNLLCSWSLWRVCRNKICDKYVSNLCFFIYNEICRNQNLRQICVKFVVFLSNITSLSKQILSRICHWFMFSWLI